MIANAVCKMPKLSMAAAAIVGGKGYAEGFFKKCSAPKKQTAFRDAAQNQ